MTNWSPAKWGPPFWHVIHIAALYIDFLFTKDAQDAKRRWVKFLDGITHVVPCSNCEFHFTKFQETHPPPMASGGMANPQCLRWTIQAHNAVRHRNHKAQADEDQVVQAYVNGQIFALPSDVHLHQAKSKATVLINPLASKLIGWQVGFALACVALVVVVIVLLKKKRHPQRLQRSPDHK